MYAAKANQTSRYSELEFIEHIRSCKTQGFAIDNEDEFSNDGGFDGKPHFEWGDIPEDDNLFEGDEWKPNQKLVEANERYKSEVKKMKAKQKRKNKD